MKITQHINKKALFAALLSFCIGTLLLITHLFFAWPPVIGISIYFLSIAILSNLALLLPVLINISISNVPNKENIYTVLVSLCNIPIALGYFLIVIKNT